MRKNLPWAYAWGNFFYDLMFFGLIKMNPSTNNTTHGTADEASADVLPIHVTIVEAQAVGTLNTIAEK